MITAHAHGVLVVTERGIPTSGGIGQIDLGLVDDRLYLVVQDQVGLRTFGIGVPANAGLAMLRTPLGTPTAGLTGRVEQTCLGEASGGEGTCTVQLRQVASQYAVAITIALDDRTVEILVDRSALDAALARMP